MDLASIRQSLKVLPSLALLIVTTSCSQADGVDEAIKSHLTKERIPGVSVVVLKGGKVIKAEGYGLADVEKKAPVEATTVFHIASMSKPFTATGIMMLVEEGKLSLDDPVSRHLDGCAEEWKKITIRHLLTHTSGLEDFINQPTVNLRQEVTDQQLMESIVGRPLKFRPGEGWDYSNSNYHLLAMIIRKASGQWYGDFLAERIFRPLGMEHTEVIRDSEKREGRAMGYAQEKGQLRPGSIIAIGVMGYGGGGVRSTVLDLAKWDAALYTEQLLKRETLEQMWSPVRLNNGTTHDYGFGWEVGQTAKHRRIWHAGRWLGFSSQIDRYVDDQLTVVVLCNQDGASVAKIARAVAGVYLPAVAAPVYKPIADKEPAMTARFMDVLRRSNEGGLRQNEFAPEIWQYLEPRLEQVRKDMSALGPIQKLTLVERAEQEGRSYRYQARFARTSLIYHFVVTKEDKISVMMPEEANQ
jgi:CubicO group peptidase (beta-lactamase class C family)